MRPFAYLAMALLGLSLSPSVQAWSAFGHRLVALLAQDRLSPEARAQLDELLALEPGADIATIAPWPDEVRRHPGHEHTGPFHYVNFPDEDCRYEAARDCPDGACIVEALPRYQAALADRTLPATQRLEALKFVVHLVGDVHQPLHAGHRDDRGGNLFQIQLKGQGTNLHAVWDYHVLNNAGLRLGEYRRHLSDSVGMMPPDGNRIRDWAEASCRLLHEARLYPARPGKLEADYLARQRPVAEQQVALAAARLARLLEGALTVPQSQPDVANTRASSSSSSPRQAPEAKVN